MLKDNLENWKTKGVEVSVFINTNKLYKGKITRFDDTSITLSTLSGNVSLLIKTIVSINDGKTKITLNGSE